MKRKARLMTDRYLLPGTLVRYDGREEGGPEFGVVVHCWFDEAIGDHDCYVAFFGDALPDGAPRQKPYVLRYGAMHLQVLSEGG